MVDATIDNFTNYNTIKVGRGNQSFSFENSGFIKNFTNYGTTEKMFWGGRVGIVTNYGTMGGIVKSDSDSTLTLDNQGIMRPTNDSWGRETYTHLQLSNGAKILIENYQIKVDTMAMTFNKFNGWSDNNSHLVISGDGVRFKDANSKIILDFEYGFQFGEKYLIGKLVTDTGGSPYKDLGVDFSRLTLSDERKDIYELVSSGDSFIIRLLNQITETPITAIYKANVRTMNNFYTISNSMIYPHKSQNLRSSSLRASARERGNPFALSSLRADSQNLHSNPPYEKSLDSALDSALDSTLDSALDSAIPLKSYESFSYRNEAQTRRIQRQNKRNYSRQRATNTTRGSILDEKSGLRSHEQGDRTRSSSTKRVASLHDLSPKDNARDYYFILTPFINYNSFAKSGRYNLSGFDYGFLTAFSAKIAESNHLGTHFIFSYGSLGDKQDKNLSIKSLNLNLGINYKLDLIFDMFLKARGDFYYFLNAIDSLTIKNIKPNNLGFGLSMSYGKDFDFKQGGVLGVEVGLDYKGLQSSTISLQNNATKSISETYNKALYNLLYADLGLNYNKYFGDFGINVGLGIRGNITANKLAKSKIYLSSFNKRVDLTLDNDMFLGYANLGASYVLNTKNFDMEFSLQYFGNFGDRGMSNGGGVEWRVNF